MSKAVSKTNAESVFKMLFEFVAHRKQSDQAGIIRISFSTVGLGICSKKKEISKRDYIKSNLSLHFKSST